MQETWVQFWGKEDPLEKGIASHSSILAWWITWTDDPSRLQSIRLQRVRHDWATNTHNHFLLSQISYLTFRSLQRLESSDTSGSKEGLEISQQYCVRQLPQERTLHFLQAIRSCSYWQIGHQNLEIECLQFPRSNFQYTTPSQSLFSL